MTTDFERDGVVVIRGLLRDSQIVAAAQAIADAVESPTWRAVSTPPEQPGRFFEDFCLWSANSTISEIAHSEHIAELAAELMASATVRLHHDHVLVKEPGTTMRTPWHQDQPYYNLDGTQTVSFWIPVDPVPATASLEVVAGSHLGPWLMPRTFIDKEAKWFADGTLADVPDIEADRATFDIRSFDMQPGDAVAFNMLSLHGAAGFVGPGRRRVLSLRYIGDDVRHAPRPWTTSPEFPGLADELLAGAPFDHPAFPVVWPRR